MDSHQVERTLADSNPWWRDAVWEERDVQLRRAAQAPFSYTPDVLRDLTQGGLYLLRGPRRVGKSTEIKRTIAGLISQGVPPRSIVHASVEGWSARDLEQLISHAATDLVGQPGECYWFFDEVTAVDGPWPAVVKRMRDSNLQFAEDTVVLSGSSATQLEEATKALAGRRGRAVDADRLLFQMPFVEVARALGYDVPQHPALTPAELGTTDLAALVDDYRPWVPGLVDAWDRYLRIGGYPQAVADHLEHGVVDASLLAALFDVVHGDALARASLSPAQTVAVLRGITRSLTSTISLPSVATDAGIVPETAGARLEDLRRSFLAYPVHREQGLAPKPRSQAKWYFTDPLLAGLAAGRGAGTQPDTTALNEQQLAIALLRALERTNPAAGLRHDQLLYYRSSTRAEIDFVAAAFEGICVESKYVDRGWGRAFQTIASSPYRRGIVATRSGLQQHDGGWAIPAALLAAILGS